MPSFLTATLSVLVHKNNGDAGDGGAITIAGSNAATITVDGLISGGGANTGTSGAGGAITFETAGVNLINLNPPRLLPLVVRTTTPVRTLKLEERFGSRSK